MILLSFTVAFWVYRLYESESNFKYIVYVFLLIGYIGLAINAFKYYKSESK